MKATHEYNPTEHIVWVMFDPNLPWGWNNQRNFYFNNIWKAREFAEMYAKYDTVRAVLLFNHMDNIVEDIKG